MYFLAPPSSCKQIIVPLKHSSMLPQNKNRLIFGRPKESWHWTICHSLPLPSKHLCFSKTSWRRLQHNNSLSSKTTSGRVCNTSSTNAFKTSSRCLQDVFARRLQDVFKTSSRLASKMSSSSLLEEVFKTSSWRRLAVTSWRRTSWKTKKCYTEDVFSTSSPRRMFGGWACPVYQL